MLKLYNSLVNRVVTFKPLKDKQVNIYSCGPTVYGRSHLGNLSSFLMVDLLRRYLNWSGYRTIQVMNLTDVDDKTIKGAQKAKVSLETYTRPYIEYFFKDLDALNIIRAEYYPKATDYINQMVEMIIQLIKRGYAYQATDKSIYYKVKKFNKYGQLVHLKKQKLRLGARVSQDIYNKNETADFALWKAWTPADGDIFWETELGRGRPGWHIECSAMSTAILGPTIDIHTGAIDLKFPHHSNEIAQSEGATGKTFVRFWVHRSFLRLGEEKMAKSLGNILNLDDIREKGFAPEVFRYLVISNHYRTPLVYTEKLMRQAKNSLKTIHEFIYRLQNISSVKQKSDLSRLIQKTKTNFIKEMDHDLNTPRAFSCLFKFIKQINCEIDKERISQATAKKIIDYIYDFDSVLGLLRQLPAIQKPVKNDEIGRLLNERKSARLNKNFEKADKIRQSLLEHGIEVRDNKNGEQIWQYIK